MKNNYSGPHHEWHQKIRRDFCNVFGESMLFYPLCDNDKPGARPFGAWHLDFPHLRLDLAVSEPMKDELFKLMFYNIFGQIFENPDRQERTTRIKNLRECINPNLRTIDIRSLRRVNYFKMRFQASDTERAEDVQALQKDNKRVMAAKTACHRPTTTWHHKPTASIVG